MARDIEEFLRKAAERRAAQQQGKRPGGANPPAARSPGAAPAERRPAIADDMAEEPDPFPSGQTVAEHVQQHIGAGAAEISQHTRQLGRELDQAGQRSQARVQQNLDHQLGQLGGGQGKGKRKQKAKGSRQPAAAESSSPPTIAPAAAPPVIGQVGPKEDLAPAIARLLRSPQAIKQAIIIAELLKRPEWD